MGGFLGSILTRVLEWLLGKLVKWFKLQSKISKAKEKVDQDKEALKEAKTKEEREKATRNIADTFSD